MDELLQVRGDVIDFAEMPFKDTMTRQEAHTLQGVYNKLCLRQVVDFDFRIVRRLRESPARLLLFAKAPPHVPCQQRQQLAKDIIEADEATLHIAALKVRRLYFEELASATGHGIVPVGLWGVWHLIATKWRADTQD